MISTATHSIVLTAEAVNALNLVCFLPLCDLPSIYGHVAETIAFLRPVKEGVELSLPGGRAGREQPEGEDSSTSWKTAPQKPPEHPRPAQAPRASRPRPTRRTAAGD